MQCKVSCSFGEVVDKFSILNIKKNKTNNSEQLKNINNELEILKIENPQVNNDNELFNQLSLINSKLWVLEDVIRYKSSKKEFDQKYIECAESIHFFNDKRAEIKRKINQEFNSFLKEEKIYTNYNKQIEQNSVIQEKDLKLLEKGKKYYVDGMYKESLEIIEKLYNKHIKNDNIDFNNFTIELCFSYWNSKTMFTKDSINFNILKKIVENLYQIDCLPKLKDYCKEKFCICCLQLNKFELAYHYLNNYNCIKGPGVNRDNMSFFKNTDTGKTLFLYDGGGIGDKIMLSRFVPIICNEYSSNNIILLINIRIAWVFQKIFAQYKNLKIITEKDLNNNLTFDYHTNLIQFFKHFSIKKREEITFSYLFDKIDLPKSQIVLKILDMINNSSKKTYVFNWKGNTQNPCEKFNRSMNLKLAISLFKLDVNWIVVSKDLTDDEKQILNKYNIWYYNDVIDKDIPFMDTINIFQNVDGIFSTDTSLLHIAANINIPTYALLTYGCDWRWSGEKCYWYPNIKMLKQEKQGDWSPVINKIKDIITN